MTPEERFYENMRFAARVLHTNFPNSAWDEDLLQEAYIGLWKACLTFSEDKGKFTTYAGVCIRNEILMEFRRRAQQPPTLSLDAPMPEQERLTFGDILEDPKLELDPNLYDLEKFLKGLNGRERKLVSLRLEGLNQKQIASIIGRSQSWVSRLLRDIEKRYNKEMNE